MQKLSDAGGSAFGLNINISALISSFGAMAAKAAIAAGAAAVVALAVGTVAKAIDDSVHYYDRLIEAGDNVIKNGEAQVKSHKSNIDALKQLKPRFDELSEGVDDYGKNLSLTTEEYDEYNSIVQEIAKISPDLVAGYDLERGAIINKNEAIENDGCSRGLCC